MKYWIQILIGVFFTNATFSQYIYSDTTWERWYGVQNYHEFAPGFKKDIEHYDYGYIFHANNEGYTDLKSLIKKTDINGYFLWERKLDSTINKSILSVKNYHDGGVLLCGTYYYSNNGNPWVAKLNACMEVEWCKIFEWHEYSYAIDIDEDQNGDIVVLTYGYGEYIYERVNLIKLSPDGDVLWKEHYASRHDYPHIWNASPYKLLINADNSYYLVVEADWPNNNDPGQGSGIRSIFIKVSPDGKEEWILPFGIYDGLYTRPWTLQSYSNDTFMAIGDNYETVNPVIMFFNSEGEELSFITKHIMPETYYSSRLANSVRINDTSFMSVWRYKYTIEETSWHHGYMIFDTALNVIDYMEDDRWRGASSFIKTFNNRFVTISRMKENNSSGKDDIYLNKRNLDFSYDTVYENWSGNFDTLCEEGVVSGYLPYTCDMIVGVEEVPSTDQFRESQEKVSIHIHPNPAKNQVIISLENTSKFSGIQMSVYNQTGEEIYHRKLRNDTQEELLNINSWSSGMYFIVIRSENKIVGSAKLMVE